MSATAVQFRKRSIDSLSSDSPIESKRQKKYNYYRLASESPAVSNDDTESVYSVQGRETERVKDTSDTDTESPSEYEVEIEYDIESLSENDKECLFSCSSSGNEDVVLAAAAVVCDSSLDAFITDAEDSDNSRQDDSSSGPRDFWTCVQCKSQNDNPQYRFCHKCFQDRKMFFPPRPRRHKKAKRSKEKSHSPVKLDALQSCLSGLSQDSGIGSSQEFATNLCLDQIVVPAHLTPSTSLEENNRKRQISESSLSEEYEVVSRPKKAKKEESKDCSKQNEVNSVVRTEEASDVKGPLPEMKEICMMCNLKPKNSVFLHGRIAHMCCCYGCAMRTWKSMKRCPICKRQVSNVVRVFTT